MSGGRAPIQVTVTGGAGQIGYSLLFRVASGQMFGQDQPLFLRMLEVEPAMKSLEGVAMELDDCAFPLLAGMELTSKAEEAFDGANWVLLVGAAPRKQGMERSDLLSVNGGIFAPQGKAIAKKAASDVRILVVGNPCNTNCYIARMNAPEIPEDRWFAMTRLDENRARTQLAQKAKVPVAAVSNVAVWGNHSTTQYPDAHNARIAGLPVEEVIKDHGWLKGKFVEIIQKRGAAVIEARGSSSAASAFRKIRASSQTHRRESDGRSERPQIDMPTPAGTCPRPFNAASVSAPIPSKPTPGSKSPRTSPQQQSSNGAN